MNYFLGLLFLICLVDVMQSHATGGFSNFHPPPPPPPKFIQQSNIFILIHYKNATRYPTYKRKSSFSVSAMK